MTPAQFVEKWKRVRLPERAASQEHFIDLCRLLAQPTPAEHDETGAEYAFEKGVDVAEGASRGAKGDRGYADVWWKGKFGWEYKRRDKYKTLDEAYSQLLKYREALESPPLLIVSDIERIEIHTNFTGTKKQVHTIALDELDKPESLAKLRRVFTEPESFRPTETAEKVTEDVARQLGKVAGAMRDRGHEPHATAHFLMKCMFCLFAEDVGLLPKNLFKNLLEKYDRRPKDLKGRMDSLFEAMRTGGAYGSDDIAHFNGGLFDDAPAIELTTSEIDLLNLAAAQDWGSVEPAVFGTLFERSLDPAKRSQIGAHYTSREDILLVIEPVIMEPLRREWGELKEKVAEQTAKRAALMPEARKTRAAQAEVTRLTNAIEKQLVKFADRLASVTVLDPACGSGNFLYVAIQRLLDLEKEVITFAAKSGIGLLPRVRPTQLRGIEINPYAAELAQVVIWIGFLQWMRDNGFRSPDKPILSKLQSIENRDAILKTGKSGQPLPQAAEWPEADFIVGNPPFLGSKLFRKWGLSDEYLNALFAAYDLPKTSDLCCYWFELGRRAMEEQQTTRIGLLATQGIRGGDNRTVLERVLKRGQIFSAWSDREWVLDGAAVNVSIIGFTGSGVTAQILDDALVGKINADLTIGANVAEAVPLHENEGIAFMGDTKGGPFELTWEEARELLNEPNSARVSNRAVLSPWANGVDVVRRARGMWIIDFGVGVSRSTAAQFEAPFRFVEERAKPARATTRQAKEAEEWWLHVRPRPEMRAAIRGLNRFGFTVNVAKHRLFVWLKPPLLPDHAGIAFARADDFFLGVLHSSAHELWALRMGTHLEDRPRYTPTTCFETFPLPWPPGKEKASSAEYKAIAAAAKALNEQRERWLNPPEWIEPIANRIDREDRFEDVPEEARGLIRESAIMAAAAKDARLKKRTLTNLYNERPEWLKIAHETLDRAVLAAYALVDPKGGWKEEWAAVWRETGAGGAGSEDAGPERAAVEEKVLANLLRMNGLRARGKAAR